MNTYELVGILLSQYLDELSAVADERRMTTFELISLERERQLTPQLSMSLKQLTKKSIKQIPAGRL